MTKRQILFTDRMSGMTDAEIRELNELEAHLYDKNGIAIMPETEEETRESIEKAMRYGYLMQKRCELWKAILN